MQCALLDRVSPLAIEGSWEDEGGYPLDACLTDTEFQLSYLRRAHDASLGDPLINGYADGSQFLFGKVATGTWYEEDSAGPLLLFIRNNGHLDGYKWTGLLGDKGRSVIDRSQARQEEKHSLLTWVSYYGETTGKECIRFRRVKTYLLDNLPEDDDDYYFFVNDDYFDAEVTPRYYYLIESSDASILVPIFSLFVAFLALM